MESSKAITSIFIVIALLAMAALAVSVNRQEATAPVQEIPLLPGLAENLHSVGKLSGLPAGHIHSVTITRTGGEELTVFRNLPDTADFEFAAESPQNLTPYSTILYANAAFLDTLKSPESFMVSGITGERLLGKLLYLSFDGLRLEVSVLRSGNATWLRIMATNDQALAASFAAMESNGTTLLSKREITDLANRLNGRTYKLPDTKR